MQIFKAMRFRKKIIKGITINAGKKKTSLTIGGGGFSFNVPLTNNKPNKEGPTQKTDPPKNDNPFINGCAMVIGTIIGLLMLLGVYSEINKRFINPPLIIDSSSIKEVKDTIQKPIKKHKKRHKKKHIENN